MNFNFKSILKNQKGSFSIIGIILTITIVTIIAGYISINRNTWVNSELQSIVDISSLNALNASIDEEKLKNQIFAVKGTKAYIDTKVSDLKVKGDTSGINSVVANNFQKELNKQVRVNSMIESITVKSCKSELQVTSWGTNKGVSNLKRPQLILDSVVQVVVKNTAEFDSMGAHTLSYTDAKTGNIMSISVDGVTKDGKVVLTVRCLSRIVYR